MGYILILFIFVLPFAASYEQCYRKNRSVVKGLFLTALLTPFALGWVISICLWLGLKTRDPKTKQLY